MSESKYWLEELAKYNQPYQATTMTNAAMTSVTQAMKQLPAFYAYALGTLLLTHYFQCIGCGARQKGSEIISHSNLLAFFQQLTQSSLAIPQDSFQPHLAYRLAQTVWNEKKNSKEREKDEETAYLQFQSLAGRMCLSPSKAPEPAVKLYSVSSCQSVPFPDFVAPLAGFAPFNPSIVRCVGDEERYKVLMRTGNYVYDYVNHKWIYPGKIQTVNYLLDLYSSTPCKYRCEKNTLLYSLKTPTMPHPFYIAGFEDCRVFYWPKKNSYYASFTTLEATKNNQQRIGLTRLNTTTSKHHEECEAEAMQILYGWGDMQPQKNWLPFIAVDDGNLYFIYSFCPFTILKYVEETSKVVPVRLYVPKEPNAWRGSSSPVAISVPSSPIAYVCLVHESAFPRYAQRWVGFDQSMHVTHVSDRFCFQEYKIEFTCGMSINKRDQTFVIPYGRHDREAHLLTVPIALVLSEYLKAISF